MSSFFPPCINFDNILDTHRLVDCLINYPIRRSIEHLHDGVLCEYLLCGEALGELLTGGEPTVAVALVGGACVGLKNQ